MIGAGLLLLSPGAPYLGASVLIAISYLLYRGYLRDPRLAGGDDDGDQAGFAYVTAGMKHVLQDPFLRAVSISLVCVVVVEETKSTVLPPFFRDRHALEQWDSVLALARRLSAAVGLLAAALVSPISRKLGRHRTLVVAAAGAAVSPVLLASANASIFAVVVALSMAATAEALWVPLVQTEVVKRTRRELMARTRSAMMFLTWGSMPVGALAAGVAGESVGIRPLLYVVGALAILGCVLGIARAPRERPQATR